MDDKKLKQIEEYSSQIRTIDDFMAAVRQTLGQYISYTGSKGWLNAGRELIQNMLDEMNDPNSFCNVGDVTFIEQTQEFYVEDNGRGIPFADIERVYASPHTSKNYDKTLGNYSSGSHGVGAKVTNAVSSTFIVCSYILGKYRQVKFENGIPVESEEGPAAGQGTIVVCSPHPCMENPDLKCEDVLNLLLAVVPLYNVGTTVNFLGVKRDGSEIHQTIQNQDGLLTYLIRQTTEPMIAPIIMKGDTGEVKAEIAFTYDATDLSGTPVVESFANYCPTLMGTHVDGFLNGLCNYFRNYMNNIYLKSGDKDVKKKKKELKVCNNDIKTGLKSVVHGLSLHPTFMGQAKEGISNRDIKDYIEKQMPIWLDEWTKKNPNDFAKLCKFFKSVAELRTNADQAKEKFVEKYKKNRITNFPTKFLQPNNLKSDQLELIIVEGDSAFGSYKNSRNAEIQGLFPIRGKLINAFANSNSKVMDNEEVQAILFLLDNINWARIIFATDADIDGYHIRTLLMKLILKKRPNYIQEGRVFIAIPPLYGIQTGKKYRYFKDKMDYIKYVRDSFIRKIDIRYGDERPIYQSDLLKILYENEGYVEEMDKIAYSTDPTFLEFVLRNRKLKLDDLERKLKQEYRFLQSVTIEGNATVIRAVVNRQMQIVFLNNRFINQCSKILPYIDKGYMKFMIDRQVTGLYGLMKAFDQFSPSVIRYKGLGEMNEDQLAESTLYPSPSRKLIQYTSQSLSDDIDQIRYLESNKKELLSVLSGD